MKDRFKLFSMALCACAFAACNDNEGVDGPGDGDKSPVQYVVMSATSDGTANYLQLASDPTKGTIDEKNTNFDADTSVHSHFLCKRCGHIYDLKCPEAIKQVENLEMDGHQVSESSLLL